MKGVVDAAVVGVHHELFDEVPMAFVVKAKGSNVCENDITKFVSGIAILTPNFVQSLTKVRFRTVDRIQMVARGSEVYRHHA